MGLVYPTQFLAHSRCSINGRFCSSWWTKCDSSSRTQAVWPIRPGWVLLLLLTAYLSVSFWRWLPPSYTVWGMSVRSLSCLRWEASKTREGNLMLYLLNGKQRPENSPLDKMEMSDCSQVPRASVVFILPKAWFFSFPFNCQSFLLLSIAWEQTHPEYES